ncbi:MAG: PilZ domain-containing protein [Acidobacteria bacterium]|nr:PilZ domain-containing protein [Acidobacteriota bacterium]
MRERRVGERYNISLPIRLIWKDESGHEVMEEGLTENVGPKGALVYLPRNLPQVGSSVNLVVTDQAEEVSVTAEVLRLERNASHPLAALMLTKSIRLWKEKVCDYAAKVLAEQQPEELDDW